ncbi:hypothetical protein [Sphingobacterium sp. E70]|nr:hypothetical protein [Sphingobacterium sp. E70]
MKLQEITLAAAVTTSALISGLFLPTRFPSVLGFTNWMTGVI